MPTPYDALGVVSLVLGILAVIPITRWIKNRLPNTRLRYLYEIVGETEALLLSLEEDNIFSKPETAVYYRQRLRRVREDAQQYRWSTYQATTTIQQLRGLFSGLSKKLSNLCDEALEPRAEISTTATDERKQLLAERSERSSQITDGLQQPQARATICMEPRSQISITAVATRILPPPRICSATRRGDTTSKPTQIPMLCDLSDGESEPPTLYSHARSQPHRTDDTDSRTRKKHHTDRFLRRSRRFRATRSYFSRSVAQMEYRKCGVLRNEEYRRVLRSRTVDSLASTATCVDSQCTSTPGCLKTYVPSR